MKFSKKGYLRNSPDVNNSQNIIQGGKITMKGVDFKVKGVDNNGYSKIMPPGNNYTFPNAKYVIETPIKNKNMAPFKLRLGKGDMPKTGRSIPSPFRQEADEVSGEPVMVPVTGSGYRLSNRAKRKAYNQAVELAAKGYGGTYMGSGSGHKGYFRIGGKNLLSASTGSRSGIDVTGLSGEETATGGFSPYTIDQDKFYEMLESGTVSIMPTADGTNMFPTSFQEREETTGERVQREREAQREIARQKRREKQNGFTQAEDVPVDTTTGVNSTPPTEPLTREQRLQELKLKRQQDLIISKERARQAVAERKLKLEELKRRRQKQ